MEIDIDEIKSVQVKVMQIELKRRNKVIENLASQLKSEKEGYRVIFVCWIVTLMLYFFK